MARKGFLVWVVLLFALVSASPAFAALIKYDDVILDGSGGFSTSAGTGNAGVFFDTTTHTLNVQMGFSGLTGTTTAMHIHAATAVAGVGTAGVATMLPNFLGFPLGVTVGSFSNLFFNRFYLTDLASYNPAFVTANGGTIPSAEAALLLAMADGKAYLNIHTTSYPGGEIRGFLVPTAVPEPSTMLLLGSGLVGLVGYGRKRFKK